MTQEAPIPELTVRDFNFHLPEELIAQQPPAQRGSSRMLVVQLAQEVEDLNRTKGTGFSPYINPAHADGALAPEGGQTPFIDLNFHDLPSLLNPGDLLVLNDSRVIPARLYAHRANARGKQDPTGQIEVFLTTPDAAGNWTALVRPGRKVRTGDTLEFFQDKPASQGFVTGHDFSRAENTNPRPGALAPATPILRAQVLASGQFGERTLRFDPVEDFYAVLDQIGHIPLPPYIKRDDQTTDRERYQTVFAHDRGSVAAPTAGLHFTPEIFAEIAARGVEVAKITLHVGLGTFAPLRVEKLSEIQLHRERYTLSQTTAEALNRARQEGRRIVAVGTTTVRTLEHVAHESHDNQLQPHTGETQIFIQPGHQFQLVDAMLTNFHLPQSSLLMLVSAFAGRERILAAYQHAVQQKYRFFSYGDCMFLS
jgi:S-adenosylmethionine:tRNA ribosyltransferase-isomerase